MQMVLDRVETRIAELNKVKEDIETVMGKLVLETVVSATKGKGADGFPWSLPC